jgi:TrmH family RNA methyltransferase
MPNKSVTNKNSISDLTIVLDNIQDPGNLGTIIRTANWFGVNNIFCSQNTVDSYNQKVIQSTMGAIFRVNIFYTDIALFIKEAIADKKEIYGALLSGTNIYKSTLNNDGIIVLGNESKGISTPIQELISNRIKIPNYPENTNSMESLNVSIACGIILSEFRRQNS